MHDTHYNPQFWGITDEETGLSDPEKIEAEDIIEKEADEMARNGLIPKRIWDRKQISGKASTAEVYALAEKLKIHPAIIAGRVRFEQNNYKLLSRHVGNKQIRQ